MPEIMIEMLENLAPFVEAAEGFRQQLIDREWPKSDAQECATAFLTGLITNTFAQSAANA